MNAIQFIKEHGVEKVREVVEGAPKGFKGYNDVINKYTRGVWFSRDVLLSDLKQIVESVDLVNCNGGWNGTKNTITLFQSSLDLGLYHGVDGVDAEVEIPRLKQAIADYEQLFGNTETLGGEHV
ncbi:hypothetical protein [Acinetobacter venetianus]|uniref:Uncharacterized protein n=1 Tax=Acinetobacter venetianus TaxID=52133 RepID=A0A150HY60_9GAMM|nr:hypothetical protein [Acinetobacter venetianus]KXZ72167.1 hypothetical protein AVENLUH13518_00778 [Acinetobacter venetianus]